MRINNKNFEEVKQLAIDKIKDYTCWHYVMCKKSDKTYFFTPTLGLVGDAIIIGMINKDPNDNKTITYIEYIKQ